MNFSKSKVALVALFVSNLTSSQFFASDGWQQSLTRKVAIASAFTQWMITSVCATTPVYEDDYVESEKNFIARRTRCSGSDKDGFYNVDIKVSAFERFAREDSSQNSVSSIQYSAPDDQEFHTIDVSLTTLPKSPKLDVNVLLPCDKQDIECKVFWLEKTVFELAFDLTQLQMAGLALIEKVDEQEEMIDSSEQREALLKEYIKKNCIRNLIPRV